VHPGLHLVVLRDVSEKYRLEEALRQSQKMEAVGRLAGSLAHDFNNYLTAIRGFGEVVLERLEPEDPLADSLLEIQKAADRATRLTRQLLAISRKQVLQPRPVDLNAVLAGLENMLRSLLGSGVRLHLALESGLSLVRADPGQIEQVVLNLVVNARDAMPQGGALVIQTARVEVRGLGAHPDHLPPGRYVRLGVEDTGQGMDPDTLSHVFEPFFTTKPAGRGTGLGLSTVYGIVQQNHGFVWVYSEPGRGSTFKVYLPRVDEAAEEVPDATAPDSARGTETILLVEDEASLRAILRELLESYGYTVIDAGNGVNALRVAEEHRGAIHLLLSDVVMPHMTGRELSERLARRRRQMRVLLMSGYAGSSPDPLVPESAAFIEKPFTAQAFLRRVRDVLSPAS
jgi:two-component system cell cycle sensor histidine kinase/response regulator CckA